MSAASIQIDYRPNSGQRRFHAACRKHRFVAFIAGIRSGKTLGGAVEALYRALDKVATYGAIGPTYGQLRDSTMAEWNRVVPASLIRRSVTHPEPECELVNGSVIHFRSAERPDRLRGPTWGGFWFDESAIVRTHEAFNIAIGRVLSTLGWGITTTTPKGRNWVFDKFLGRDKLPGSHVVTMRTADAEHLSEEAIEHLRAAYSSNMAAQELDAVFVEGWDGMVYPEFRFDVHVSPDPLPIMPGRAIDLGVDWGVVNPTVVLAAQRDASDRLLILREKRFTNMSASQTARATKAWLRDELGYQGRLQAYRDPSGKTETLEWTNAGFRMLGSTRPVAEGIEVLHKLMELRPDGRPGIIIDPSCVDVADEFSRYQRSGKGDEILKQDDHGCDAARYLAQGVYGRPVMRVRR